MAVRISTGAGRVDDHPLRRRDGGQQRHRQATRSPCRRIQATTAVSSRASATVGAAGTAGAVRRTGSAPRSKPNGRTHGRSTIFSHVPASCCEALCARLRGLFHMRSQAGWGQIDRGRSQGIPHPLCLGQGSRAPRSVHPFVPTGQEYHATFYPTTGTGKGGPAGGYTDGIEEERRSDRRAEGNRDRRMRAGQHSGLGCICETERAPWAEMAAIYREEVLRFDLGRGSPDLPLPDRAWSPGRS